MTSLLRDLNFGLRTLWKNPTFALVAILTLGLGIGANVAIFSVVNAMVVRPLPYPQPERLVRLYTALRTQKLDRFWISPPEYFDLSRAARSFASLGAWTGGTVAIGGGDQPERIPGVLATESLLRTMGVAPALGRLYGADEDRPGQPGVVLLSHIVWQRSFAGDRNIVGRTITLEGAPVKVVGVMPPGFDFPPGAEIWIPAGEDPASAQRGNHRLSVVARLLPTVSIEQARAELAVLMAGWSQGQRDAHLVAEPDHPMLIYPLKAETVGSVKGMLMVLQGAVLFVLLISCANVSNLLLARAETRGREIAIRSALGARRGRLVRQFMTESLLLGSLGGLLGLLLAYWGVDAAVALLPEGAPRANEIAIDGAVMAYALASALVTSLLFGLAPVWHWRSHSLPDSLKESQRTTGSPARQRFRRVLVVVETALAVVMVIGCGLMIRSFASLSRVDVGFRPDHLLTFQVQFPTRLYPERAQVGAFLERSVERLRALPGVTQASLMTGLPPVRPLNANDVVLEGQPPPRPNVDPPRNVDFWQTVEPGYFATMGVKLLEGRLLDARDGAEAGGVVVINQTMACRFWPDRSPLGKQVRVEGRASMLRTIVGVVGDIKQQGMESPTGTEIYFPLRQTPQMDFALRSPTFVLRTSGEPMALIGAVRGAMTELDPSLPVARVRTMVEIMYDAVARPRFLTILLGVFAALALVLATVGIYGVMSYTVARRTSEIGIRMALGAQVRDVRGFVLREGLGLAAAGTALGLAAAVLLDHLLARLLGGLLFQVRVLDPSTFALMPLVVVLVAALACWIPARRATRIDPMVALRRE